VIEACANCGFSRAQHSYNGACYGLCGKFVPRSQEPIRPAGPFEAAACAMPKPAPIDEASVYEKIRDLMIASHCADQRPAHRCAGTITITRDAITFQCPRCGDAKQLLGEVK
jgi:hypothetical protein